MATALDPTKQLQCPMTVEQWAAIEDAPHLELVDGEVVEKPDVALWHELLLMHLARYLANYIHDHRLGWLVTSNGPIKLTPWRGRKPDIFFIPKPLAQLVGKNLFKGIPPLVVEILSPTNEAVDRVTKRREYTQLGIEQYWIVDFPQRRIEVYVLRQLPDGARDYELAETVSNDAVFRPTMFPGLEIPLADIWPAEFENRTDE